MQLEDVICRREAGSAVVEGVKQEWVWHSPSGFEWGSGGSGPAYLALNILLAATGDRGLRGRASSGIQVAVRGETAVRRRGDCGFGDSGVGHGASPGLAAVQ